MRIDGWKTPSPARADLSAGRAWKARDRLTGLLTHRADDAVLDLLAEVHSAMGDLPAAGALWFVTGRDDDAARAALAAWRERHGSDDERWRSIPAPVRRAWTDDRMRSLEAGALRCAGGGGRRTRNRPLPDGAVRYRRRGPDPVAVVVVVLGAWVLLTVVVGTWTVVRWLS